MFRSALVSFALLFAGQGTDPRPDVTGNWKGALSAGSAKLRLTFKIEKKDDGTYSTKMDSLDQGAKDVPIQVTKVEDNQLIFEAPNMKAEYKGKLSADLQMATGEWKQGSNAFPLELKRVDKPSEVRRPQEPKRPFPYLEEEVTIPNEEAKIALAGTFTRPKTGGPFATVVLVSGSGPQDRDETLLGHKPFLVISDHLTRQGIAVLRYDDRGIGKSTGKHGTATTADFATDAHAAVKYLQARKDVNSKRIGIAGHSEGGLIGPLVAASHPDAIAFLILLAGPGVPGSDIIMDQVAVLSRAAGEDETVIKLGLELQRKLLDVAMEGGPSDEMAKRLEETTKNFIKGLSDEQRKLAEKEMKKAELGLKVLSAPWFQYFLKHDPRPTLAKVRCPVLALNGQFDLQVTPKLNLPAIGTALKEGGNTRVTLTEMPRLNHLFQHCTNGLLSEYATIEETFAPEVLQMMTQWILSLK